MPNNSKTPEKKELDKEMFNKVLFLLDAEIVAGNWLLPTTVFSLIYFLFYFYFLISGKTTKSLLESEHTYVWLCVCCLLILVANKTVSRELGHWLLFQKLSTICVIFTFLFGIFFISTLLFGFLHSLEFCVINMVHCCWWQEQKKK